MNSKKIIKSIILPLLVLSSGVVSTTACKNTSSTSIIEQEKSILFELSNIQVQLYDRYQLEPILVNVDASTLTYASSNENVATVSADGVISPVAIGETVIIVKSGNVEAKVNVTIPEDIIVPTLSVDTQSITLITNKSYTLVTNVNFNGKVVKGDLNFRSNNSGVATVTDKGVVTAVKEGTTTIVVGGNYNGYSFEELTVEVSVFDDVDINLSLDEVKLFTSNPTGEYKTEENVTCSLKLNGEISDSSSIVWRSENTDVAMVNNGKITAVKEGETNVYAEYQSNGKTYASYVHVEVIIPEVDFDEKIEVSISEIGASKSFDLPSTFDLSEYKYAVIDGDVVESTTSSSAVLISKEVLNEHTGVHKISFISEKAILSYNVEIVTKYIRTFEDLISISSYETAYQGVTVLDGYFVLKNDIDCDGKGEVKLCKQWTNRIDAGFVGTFDGAGHVLYNINSSSGGVFNCVGEKGVIKNVAFINMQGISHAVANEFRGLIDNVMVTSETKTDTSLMSVNAVVSNSFFIYKGEKSRVVGTIFDATVSLVNVYAITLGTPLNNTSITMTGSILETSMISLKQALKTVDISETGFDVDVWTTYQNLPVFKEYLPVAQSGFEVTCDTSELIAGQVAQIKSNVLGTTYAASEDDEHISVTEDGQVSVILGAPSSFSVVATSPYGATRNVEFSFDNTETNDRTNINLGDVDLSVDSVTLDFEDVDGTINSIAFNGGSKTTSFSATSTSLTFNTSVVPTNIAGDSELWIYTTTSEGYKKIYRYSVCVVTKVLNTLDDIKGLYAASGNVSGYYVLGADIDGSSLNGFKILEGYTQEFCATLDGRGHILNNFNVNDLGLFRGTFNGAIIKNIGFVNLRSAATTHKRPLGCTATSKPVLFDNVFLDSPNTIQFIAGPLSAGHNVKNTIVYMPAGQKICDSASGNIFMGNYFIGPFTAAGTTRPTHATKEAFLADLESESISLTGSFSYENGHLYFAGHEVL